MAKDKKLLDSSHAMNGWILIAEDHYCEGGIGQAMTAATVGKPGITITCLMVGSISKKQEAGRAADDISDQQGCYYIGHQEDLS